METAKQAVPQSAERAGRRESPARNAVLKNRPDQQMSGRFAEGHTCGACPEQKRALRICLNNMKGALFPVALAFVNVLCRSPNRRGSALRSGAGESDEKNLSCHD